VKFLNPWEKTDPVRLVNLLEHSTGWPDISLRVLNIDRKDWSVLRGVQETSPEFVSRWAPGHFTVYNNAGPAVAAAILEKAAQQHYEDYMKARVLRPMGMASADFDLPPALAARIATSYAPDGSIAPYQYIILKPAGSLNTDARQLAQLIRLMLGRGTVDGHRVLSPGSVARLERGESNLAAPYGFTQAYGLGNAPFPEKGVSFRGHNGQIDAFTAVEGYSVRCNCGYVVMANGGSESAADFGSPTATLIEAYLTRGMKPEPPPTVAAPEATLAKYDGYYRVITPPNDLVRPFSDVLSFTRMRAGHGKLTMTGLGGTNDYLPVTDHLFRRADREEPGAAFVEKDGEIYRINALNAAVRVPGWQMALYALIAALVVTGPVVALLLGIAWLALLFGKRHETRHRLGYRILLLPLLSFAALVATFGMALAQIAGSGTSAIATIASPTPYAIAIFVFSLAFPIPALAGLWTSWRARDVAPIARGYIAAFSAALIAVSVYALLIGWVGMRIWTM
jgi:CubicO group peptidase (beta-lactamase class C family)